MPEKSPTPSSPNFVNGQMSIDYNNLPAINRLDKIIDNLKQEKPLHSTDEIESSTTTGATSQLDEVLKIVAAAYEQQ